MLMKCGRVPFCN